MFLIVKFHHRVEKMESSFWSVLNFVEIHLGMSLTRFYKINLKKN